MLPQLWELPPWFCFCPGDWRNLCTAPSVEALWQMSRTLECGLVQQWWRPKIWGSKRSQLNCLPLYFLILPETTYYSPSTYPTVLWCICSVLDENLLDRGFMRSLLISGIVWGWEIVYSLGGDGKAGKTIHRNRITFICKLEWKPAI